MHRAGGRDFFSPLFFTQGRRVRLRIPRAVASDFVTLGKLKFPTALHSHPSVRLLCSLVCSPICPASFRFSRSLPIPFTSRAPSPEDDVWKSLGQIDIQSSKFIESRVRNRRAGALEGVLGYGGVRGGNFGGNDSVLGRFRGSLFVAVACRGCEITFLFFFSLSLSRRKVTSISVASKS